MVNIEYKYTIEEFAKVYSSINKKVRIFLFVTAIIMLLVGGLYIYDSFKTENPAYSIGFAVLCFFGCFFCYLLGRQMSYKGYLKVGLKRAPFLKDGVEYALTINEDDVVCIEKNPNYDEINRIKKEYVKSLTVYEDYIKVQVNLTGAAIFPIAILSSEDMSVITNVFAGKIVDKRKQK